MPEDTLADRFALSLQRFTRGRQNVNASAAANEAARQALIECARICESPIELAMCFALGIAAHERTRSMAYNIRGRLYGKTRPDLLITPQTQIHFMRVDFLLTATNRHLVVECDGHEFHSRTAKQAIRDRERDRQLQKMGFSVFRYTGSDIWKDVFRCADEAVSFLCPELPARKSPTSVGKEKSLAAARQS